MKNPYELLEVDTNASVTEIKKSYRKKAKQYHPDLNPGDEEAAEHFKELSEAYAILSDDEKRRKYDTYGAAAFENGGMGAGGFDMSGFADLFDIFDLFGGGGGRARRANPNAPMQGEDIHFELVATFKEAVFGAERTIQVPTEVECSKCHGHGTADGERAEVCPTCHGTGEVQQRSVNGFMSFVRNATCPTCQGNGKLIEEACDKCHGSGRDSMRKSVKISIPEGVDDGNILPIRGHGHQGKNGGPNGDLYVVFRVEKSDIFTRQGDDLYYELPISFPQAALGDTVQVATLEGLKDFEIPAGTQPGQRFTMKGEGVPNVHTKRRGNLKFDVVMEVPKHLNDEQQEALRAYSKTMGESPEGIKKSFFDKVKDIFD